MGRTKERKGRLDKGSAGTSEFIGFGAFAATPSQQYDQTEPAPQLKWSLVYAGSDSQVALLFKKINQKRDSVTKARALNELEAYFNSQEVARKDKVSALCHLLFVYHSKLSYDSSSAVRAAALSCLNVARLRVPKAFKTLWEQHLDLQGMVYCTRADPAAEVRAIALEGPPCSQQGICEYVSRILGYGRARNMHDALFVRKMDPGELSEVEREQAEERFERIVGTALSGMGDYAQQHPEETCDKSYAEYLTDEFLFKGLVSSKSSIRRKTYAMVSVFVVQAKSLVYGPTGLSTLPKQLVSALAQEKDAVNILPLLELLLLYVTSFPNGAPKWTDVVDVSLLCKHLNKTIRKACYRASARVWGPTMLPLIASLPTHYDDHEPLYFQKHLLSSLWQGRENANGTGDALYIGAAVAECSSFLLLRRQQDQTQTMEVSTATNLADFFLKALGQYLATNPVSLDRDADRQFGETLARDFCNMKTSQDRSDCALSLVRTFFWNDGVRAAILDATSAASNVRLSQLIHYLLQEEGRATMSERRTVHVNHLHPVLRKKFHLVLSEFQSTSASVPGLASYDTMISCMEYCGPRYIFETPAKQQETTPSTGMELFILNDLLRWIVIHSSSLPSGLNEGPRDNLLKRDFTLLRLCVPTLPSPLRQKDLWESILKEVFAAKCDLDRLATGITVLLDGGRDKDLAREWVEILRSNDLLEKLAIEVGIDASQQYRSSLVSLRENASYSDQESEASDEGVANKYSFFLRICVGLVPGVDAMLVGVRVVREWIESACPSRERGKLTDVSDHQGEVPNPLLDTLLSLVSRGDCVTADEAQRIVVECWREGGSRWRSALDLLLVQNFPVGGSLKGSQRLVETVLSRISNESTQCLEDTCVYRSSNHAEILSMCHCWSEKATRLLELYDSAKKANMNMPISAAPLALTGLVNVDMWEESITESSRIVASHLYFCLMYLLEGINEPGDRVSLLMGCDGSMQVQVCILLSLSGADLFAAHNVSPGSGRVAQFLSFLGGRKTLPRPFIESLCHETVKTVALQMPSVDGQKYNKACRGVMVLSELVDLLFGRIQGAHESVLRAKDIREGDILWYVANKDEDEARQKVKVIKVHLDDYPRLYFTIQLLPEAEEKVSTERQTVADRLRIQPSAVSAKATGFEESAYEEESRRLDLGKVIMEQLVRPCLAPVPFSSNRSSGEIAGECLNIVLSQCGLPGKGGLGSTRYEVFKTVSSLESQFVEESQLAEVTSKAVPMLVSMSSSMGYGRLRVPSRRNFEILRFDPAKSVRAILDIYVAHPDHDDSCFDTAALSWLAVAAPALEGGDPVRQTVLLMFRLGAKLLQRGGEGSETSESNNYMANALVVLRSVNTVAHGLEDLEGDENTEEEREVYSKLIEAFTSFWESEVSTDLSYIPLGNSQHQDEPIPCWHGPFSSFLGTMLAKKRCLLANSARPFAGELVTALFLPFKCWCAFRILDAVSSSSEQLHGSETTMCDETRRRLALWKEKLHVEEAEELEDDVVTVSQWLPNRLMMELESWADILPAAAEHAEASEDMGRMLSWLCFLSFVDGAAAADVINRGAFSSYIYKCGATDHILSLALLHANLEKDRNSRSSSFSLDELLNDEEYVTLSWASALVLFRTVEVLPTLFKNWWADECPKSLSTPVSQFVENTVAPEALKRELARIRNATNLGDMQVTGSCVSREVTATYVQDECQLSIVIEIPPNFPLRNVEVDGRKTLGIPEKRWKRWALQIRLMLNNQDGTILDALLLWKENVDKEFEGVEPCPVCYSVLSVKNHELPKLECKTCNNRFHSACLFKWFHSSGKSQCVICQQPWSGTRIQ